MMTPEKQNPGAVAAASRGEKSADRNIVFSGNDSFSRPGSQIDTLLSRLDKVKSNGADKWIARCPAHEDRSPSLSIRDTGDKVLIHCFAGCDTADVLAAVGLSWQDILPPRSPEERRSHARTARQAELRRALEHERLILDIAAAKTSVWTDDDIARVRLAEERIAKIEGALHE